MTYGDFVAYLYPISEGYRHVIGFPPPCADSHLENITHAMLTGRTDTQVIPPATSDYESLVFSPDGNYIYYRKAVNA